MNRFVIVCAILFSSFVFGQNKEYFIVVKDIETQQPVENATVFIMKTKQILLTNKEGKVTFILNGASNIQVLEVNYENTLVRWAALVKNQFVVHLKNTTNKLDEIILSKESPQKLLKKLVANSVQKLAASYRLKVYVREFFMLNNKYSYYNDGLVNFQFATNQKKVNTTLLVEQNRSYGLLENDIGADLLGYNLNNIMENYSNLKYFQPVLESKAANEYDFIIKRHPKNKDYFVMSIMPLDNSKKAVDTFEIIYEPEKKLIVEFTIMISPRNLVKIDEKSSVGSKNIVRSFIKVHYRLDGPDYYLLNSNEEIAFDIVFKNEVKNIQVRNCFVTTGFNKQNFTYKDSDVFKEKTLFNKKSNILTNYWNVSGFTATDEEKAILQALEFKM
ncbi:hypothetical protein [Flavobacterium limnophilum]|uniref:hypothetical protein n=1 Tax=Flavobacterium limnophilum TaxID=3003262 RepID=UPI002482D487|nr:hypothetical protein [Flavobacterium limnophilum]